MKRRLLLGLVMALALSLSACGGSEGTTEADKESSVQSSGAATDDTDTKEEEGSKKEEVSLEALANHPVAPAEDFEVMDAGNGVAICGYKGKEEMVVVPEEIDGQKVIRIIGKAFGEGSGVKAVKIPDTVEVISEGFTGNDDLQYVIFGSGLKTVGDLAFQGCSSLKRVKLPEGVEELGPNAFYSVKSLEYIYIPESVVEMNTTAIYAPAENFVIAGKAGSVAEEYANQWNYTFEALE